MPGRNCRYCGRFGTSTFRFQRWPGGPERIYNDAILCPRHHAQVFDDEMLPGEEHWFRCPQCGRFCASEGRFLSCNTCRVDIMDRVTPDPAPATWAHITPERPIDTPQFDLWDHINGYSYRPNPVFRNGLDTTEFNGGDRLYMGVELEYVGEIEEMELQHFYENLMGGNEERLYLKDDSSVNIEIVSHPGTIRAWRNGHMIDWDQWAEWADITRAHASASAGFHIHVSRASFPSRGFVWVFDQLIRRNAPVWGVIGRRGTDNSWGAFEKWDRKYAHRIARGEESGGRNAINHSTGHSTLELRFPRSTMSRLDIIGTLELVNAARDYAVSLRKGDVKNGALRWSRFHKYVSNADLTNNGIRYMEQLGISKKTR